MTTVAYPSPLTRNTHSIAIGYVAWLFGFLGMHRFYYGKPVTGTIWFFTLGLLGVGWLSDAFLIPSMDARADRRYVPGPIDYNVAWILLVFLVSRPIWRSPLLHGQDHHWRCLVGDRWPVWLGLA